MKNMKKKTKRNLAITGLSIVLFSLYALSQNNILSVSRYSAKSDLLPSQLDGFTVAQISDFHNIQSPLVHKDILKALSGTRPDIIVITGDFLDSRRTDPDCSLDFAEKLLNIAPVYMIPGNHEARLKEIYTDFEEKLSSMGVRVLRNQCESLERGNAKINLIGIDEPTFTSTEKGKEMAFCKNLDSIGYDKSLYTIALSHRPELFSLYSEKELDLVLSGHAHGGQFRLPFGGGVFAPSQGLFPELTEGVHTEDKTTMVVSRGIGNSLFPFRLNNRPELVFITLSTTK